MSNAITLIKTAVIPRSSLPVNQGREFSLGKKILLAFSIVMYATLVSAQHEYDIWYFGSQAGMDFTSGIPVNLTNGQIYTTEGSSCISDSAGNLLFYTDGVSVWNKNHQQMVNGFGLEGGGSTSQSALIIRRPFSDSLYYIFTVGQAGSYGAAYSVVDMSLQSGNGEVILKNISLIISITEKVTAIDHSNGTDYWVIFHDLGNADFYAYQFSASGVNATPVISTVGNVHNWEIGCMKGSHDGTKLAVGVQYGDFFQLLDFDNTSGVVSNPITINCPPTAFGPYGVEFSPNDSILYGTAYSGPCVIIQWDISSNDEVLINASELALDSSNASNIGSLQLASDGKIYMAKYGDNYLGVINSPNTLGFACNYDDNGFNLSPKSSQLGLPNIPPYWQPNQNQGFPVAAFDASANAFCALTCIDFTDQSTNDPTSWQWQFPGGNPSSSTLQNPVNICYATGGSYDVTLVVTNAVGSDSIVLSNFVTVYPPPAASITQSNDTLYASSGAGYQWYTGGNAIGGATNSFYTPPQEDFYSVLITDANGCTAMDTIFFTLAPFSFFSAPDTTICQKFCLDYFDQSQNNPTSWQWSFPGAAPSSSSQQNPASICYNTPGLYDVTLITTNAFGSDTLTLPAYITVYATPPFPTITQVGYTLTSSISISYQWQLNSYNIPGATNQSYTVLQSGLYTVIVSDENGCVNSASIEVTISGIEEVNDDENIFIFPNPSNGYFMVEWLPAGQSGLNSFAGDEISISIFNALGQKVFSSLEKIHTSDYKKEIDVSSIAPGVYFLAINSNHFSVMRKIVIER